jgi:hypothetical protein
MAARTHVNVQLESTIRALLFDEPVAYHPLIARAVGSVTAGVLLAQLLYWTPRTDRPDGWFYKTRDELYQETALTRTEQETARKALKQLGVLEEDYRGLPAKRYFRVNIERLTDLLGTASEAVDPPARWRQSYPQGGGIPATKAAENPPATTENTAETTAEITSREVKPSSNRGAFSRDGEQNGTYREEGRGTDRIRQALLSKGVLPPDSSVGEAPVTSDTTDTADPTRDRQSGPPPEYIAAVVADIVKEFGDAGDSAVNVSQAMTLWHQSDVSVQAFVDLLYEVQSLVRTRRAVKNRLGYFFTCVRRALAEPPASPSTVAPAVPGARDAPRLPEGEGNVVWTANVSPAPSPVRSNRASPVFATDKGP